MFDIDKQLNELLEINHRMLKACEDEQWDKVSKIDRERMHFSEMLQDIPTVQASAASGEKIVEIIKVDQKITSIVRDAKQQKSEFIRKSRQQQQKIKIYQDGS